MRDLKVRYAESAFGFFWAFVQSLWQLALYTIVFSAILKLPLEGEGTANFPAFLFGGLIPWMAFSEGAQRAATAIVDGSHLVKKLRFPRQILVLVAVLSALIHASIALIIFLAVRLAAGGVAWGALPLLGLGIVFQVVATLGLGLALAALCVFVRDVAHGLGLILSGLFYLTPIVYPIAIVPDRFRWLMELNPLATVVALYRSFLLGSPAPDAPAVLLLGAAATIALGAGSTIFRRLSGSFADQL